MAVLQACQQTVPYTNVLVVLVNVSVGRGPWVVLLRKPCPGRVKGTLHSVHRQYIFRCQALLQPEGVLPTLETGR